jgi:DnaK suppressor protein
MSTVADSGLSLEQTERLRQRLAEERQSIAGRLAGRRASLARSTSREPDDGDWASSSADQSLLARLTDRDTKLLQEVDRAIGKLGGESYGVCELTGDPIGFDRLVVRPWARHAVAPKEQVERQRVRAAGGEVLAPAGDRDQDQDHEEVA